MKKISFLPLLTVIFILYSCEYQSSEVYNRKVNLDVAPPQIQVVELSIDADTLYIYGSMDVKFKFHSDDQKIRSVSLLLDGEKIRNVLSDSGTFTIPNGIITTGIHDLSIEINTASGTGSLADELGAEEFVSSQSWKLVMLNYYNPDLHKTIENGLLHIKWEEYQASNFKEYVIYKSDGMFTKPEIKRTHTNEFIDSSYVGERTYYQVQVITRDDISFDIAYLSLESDLPEIRFYAEDSNRYLVKWTKTKYYNAVDSFKISQCPENDSRCNNIVKSTRNPEDTIYQVTTACFGDVLYFKLRLVPRNKNVEYIPMSYSYFETSTWSAMGYPFKKPEYPPNCLQVKSDEFVYYGCDTITRYSLTQKRAVEKQAYSIPADCYGCDFNYAQVSNTGTYITSFLNCDKNILLIKGTDLRQHSFLRIDSIIPHSLLPFAVSDKGTAIVPNYYGGLDMVDLKTSSTLGYYHKNYPGYYPMGLKISANGDYFFELSDSLRLVQFKNALFTEVWKLAPQNNVFYEFDPVNPDRLIIWNGSELSVRMCQDLSVVKEIELNDELLLDIDYYNNELLAYTNGHLYVRSFEDGSLIKDVPINIDPLNYQQTWLLINHTIVSGMGLLYFIN